MMNNIKIAFFDIDGTLASNTIKSKEFIDRVPKSAKKAICLLKQNGIIPMIATGRGKNTIASFVKDLDMPDYIASNGLVVVYQGEEIIKEFLNPQQIKKALSQIISTSDMNITLETSIGDVLCLQAKDSKYHHHSYIADISNDLSKFTDYQTHQIIVSGENIKENLNLDVDGLKAKIVGPNVVNIFPTNISKATAIKKVLEILKLTKEQAIAFGDEENDLEMFGAVGYCVAMGNGNENLKAIASYVSDTVDNDGIYKACLHYQLIK